MKKSLIMAACMSALGFSAASVFAADNTLPTCSLATLHGTYGFSGTGTDGGTPYTTSGRETYDGNGHIHYYQLWDEAGVTSTSRARARTPWTPTAWPTQATAPTIIGPILSGLLVKFSTTITTTTPVSFQRGARSESL